jgi:single-strand DNA-binding protein
VSVNSCTFIGNLGSDPDVKYTPTGTCVANFSIAVNEKWTKDGQKQERTEWVRCVAFAKTAELCGKYLAKGRQVYVQGRMQTRSWEDKNTQEKKYATEIVVEKVEFLGGKGDKRVDDESPAPPLPPAGGGAMDDSDIPFLDCSLDAEPSSIAPVLRRGVT